MQAILIGFMASGKTTVGKLLAQQLTTKHTDLDSFIVRQTHQTISQIFAQHGETYFRQLEEQYLRHVLTLPGILSTGGGTPMKTTNAALLKADAAPTIWLATTGATTLQRLQNDTTRPLAHKLDTSGLLSLQEKRTPTYERVADLVIQTDQLSPQQIVEQIKKWLFNSQLNLQKD